ncbi:MAG: hypothetical protein HUJ31_11965, partial [Pseudomonadales bacterium]|nr:hypothetical protein [Pseudomonadales bacterium]
MIRNTLYPLLAGLLVLTLGACSDDNNNDAPPAEPSFSYTISGAAVKGIVIGGWCIVV